MLELAPRPAVEPDRSLDEDRLLADTLDKYRFGVQMRQQRERDWYVQREFLRGNHYAVWVNGRGIVEPPRDTKALTRPRLIYNKCRIIAETLLAYLLKQEPIFTVVGKTGEPEDQAASMVSRQVLYHYWGLLNCGEKIERAGMWTISTGKCFWHVGWNPLAGPKIPIVQRQPIAMPDGTVGYRDEVLREEPAGDIKIEVVTPFEIVPDPGAETLEDCQYLIRCSMHPVEEMKRLYPAKADKIDERGDTSGAAEAYRSLAGRTLASFGSTILGTMRDKLKRTMVIEMWHRATKDHPNGLRVVCTNSALLDYGPTPPGYDEIPFAEWTDRLVPGEFWSDGTLKDLVPLNKEMNKRLSQAVDIANKFRVKYMAVIGSLDESQITNEDGEIIEHQPGQKPEAVNPPPLPEGLLKLLELTEHSMDEMSGVVAVLQGRAGGEVRSGRQVAYQGQYGETRIALLAKHLSRFLERAGKLVLMQASANVRERRIGRIVGKSRMVETFMFTGADIKGNTDVAVETASLLGFSRTERFDKLMQLHDRKIVGGDEVLSKLEMEDVNPILEAVAQDRNNALRENECWRQGLPCRTPRHFDDHKEHLRAHDFFRKSTGYDTMRPEQREVVDEHCRYHEDMLMPEQPGEPPPMAGLTPSNVPETGLPGGPPTPREQALSEKQSGAELAEGLPPVPPVADTGAENQH